jgi:phage baseplate assembly protein W
MVEHEDDIRESLRILLSTKPGERTMRPDYGCGIRQFVFDVINDSVLTEIRDYVERAILYFEPRVSADYVAIDTSRAYDGRLDILIEYTIKTTNSRSNLVYPYYLLEGTRVDFSA